MLLFHYPSKYLVSDPAAQDLTADQTQNLLGRFTVSSRWNYKKNNPEENDQNQ